ncbi:MULTISPECIES: DUF4381 domain-containing protein [Cycloclasticus]|uniref:DUF4381 domain-containing protein n=1 Tax=Cycloclasticus pugetii TaxID=34068 RepID=A0AB33Z483_9GAMM|nr:MULTISPECIES: DUF4381 domain-containing protein [Cycloclasticus]ATI03366.1 DUF4381 domain-containing protein [Cycloclasticus sp. PY97N]EPD13838.1 hypothetical protein L196_00020 [Cycloclasticus pugetii]
MNETLPLKDIHLPAEVSWWPPALGWWLVLLVVVVVLVCAWWLYKKLTRRTAIKAASALLVDIKQSKNNDELNTLKQLSMCLRRVSISVNPRNKTAGLTGKDWLEYLDQSVDGTPFSTGIGRYLSETPYRQTAPEDIEIDDLIELCECWLKRQHQ